MIRSLALLFFTTLYSFAQYQKLDAPINAEGRTLSFHVFHLNDTKNTLKVHTSPATLDQPLDPQKHLAAVALGSISSSQSFSLSINNGTPRISQKSAASPAIRIGPQLLKSSKPIAQLDNDKRARRTFILHDGGNQWAIGYAPSISLKQLAIALAHVSKNGPIPYTVAYQLNDGSHSSIWIRNEDYHPLYLKELQKPRAALSVQ
ncbi:hypothetical protein ACFPK9_12110 [Rubritalea spongiae]|uniref:Uncharacterized protein n=1 Tax=Rubritalea spongiae TaxID=430797 RepID=A0ABW5DZS2_9BACT